MIEIDGTFGEGGGQILRTSLALSALTGKPFHIARIRGRRAKPGLRRQHLTAVLAVQRVASAEVTGAEIGSSELAFVPAKIESGQFSFDIGTAGSAMLVLQTILPPLFCADSGSSVTVRGGTHNPLSPPFDFFAETFLPSVARMGFHASARLVRHGFYPAGGGEVVAEVEPARTPRPADFVAVSEPATLTAEVVVARLPERVWEAERRALESLAMQFAAIRKREVTDSAGPGNCVMIVVERGRGDERTRNILTAFGERGRPSASVVEEVAGYTRELLVSGAATDRFLADQMLLYMAMAGGGTLTTPTLTLHATTNIAVIEKFFPVRFLTEQIGLVHRIQCLPRQPEERDG
ncbi:RNA 3'-terminal phosphate cyclase [Candidatus Sumerlaeota bacterium]|nr:RNA 3'-terminal phosphate cyclase [Candidatus Sumerlaeota bacterium]